MMSLALVSGGEAWGQSLKDILNSSTVKDVISSATGITTGQWNYVSPAVQLEGDNALKNATGSLAAGELEKKAGRYVRESRYQSGRILHDIPRG